MMVARLLILFLVCSPSLLCAEDQQQDKPKDKIEPHQEVVVVTGTFQPVPLEEIDRSVTSIDARDTPLLFHNWIDYFQSEPSLALGERAPDGVQADLSIRGSSFGQTLVLINGLRVNDAQSGHHNLDLPLPMASIERIEILRGAGSTFYGSDAVGGAVNFITSPLTFSEFRAGTAVGNFGVNQQYASASYSAKRWSEQFSFSRDFSSGFAPDRDYRSLAFSSDSHFKTALGQTSIVLAYSDRPFGADQFYGNFNSWERTKAWFGSITQGLGSKTQFAFGFRKHTDEFILFRDRPRVFENNHVDESWQAALRRRDKLSRNGTLSYGIEGYRDSIDSNNLGYHARNRGATYVNFDMRALRRFSFSIGAREEAYGSLPSQSSAMAGSRLKGEFSPNVSGGIWISSKLKLRVGASRAFRLPTYTDLYYHDPGNVGSPTLRPESAWSYEGGLDWNAGGKFAAAVTVFHRRERDGIDYVRNSPSEVWRAANIQNLRFTGVEASARLRLAKSQRLDFAYTGLHGAQESLSGLYSKYIFNYPTHNASAAWQGTLPGRVLARTRVGVTQRFARDAYPLWDAALTREFGRLHPYVQLSNLSNTSYQEIQSVPMPGRSAVVGLEFVTRKKK